MVRVFCQVRASSKFLMNCTSLVGSVVIPLLRFCCILLETASFLQHLQFLNFLWDHRFRVIWIKGVLQPCWWSQMWEGWVLPAKSLCWWCWCISFPGPERPCQPKTVSSPRSHPELQKKIRVFRDKCLNRESHLRIIYTFLKPVPVLRVWVGSSAWGHRRWLLLTCWHNILKTPFLFLNVS